MEIQIIYEDTDVVAVNKPVGVMVHGDGRAKEKTLTDWILEKYPEVRDVGEHTSQTDDSESKGLVRPGIVHRLDRDTSGILLVAKNQDAFLYFKNLFQERKIQKTYKAIVYGAVSSRTGVIDMPIARDMKDPTRWSAGTAKRGKERDAITEYTVRAKNESYSFLDVFPHTGRTHQIRVHLKALGHPIVCDRRYAPKRPCSEDLGRLALHAYSLEFEARGGATLRLEAPISDDMKRFARTQFPDLQII